MDELEMNPLYKALLSKFRRQFDIACKMSYLIAIPHSDTLDHCTIDQNFALSHILMPSKLLKSHFNPLQVGQSFDDIELDGKRLICHKQPKSARDDKSPLTGSHKLVARILAEEIGYNVYNREYKIILIDRPLVSQQRQYSNSRPDGGASSPVLSRTLLAPLSGKPRRALPQSFALVNRASAATRSQLQTLTRRINKLQSHDDCFDYLESLSQTITQGLEEEIQKLQSTYLILADYLDDAAERLKRLAQSYLVKYERLCPPNIESSRQTLILAIENAIVHLMHGKLMVAIQEHCEKEDKILMRKLNQISHSHLNVCHFGAQKYFSDFHTSDELLHLLRHLPTEQSPITIVNKLLKSMQLIRDGLNQSVEFKRLLCGMGAAVDRDHRVATSLREQYNQEAVFICSDDLIATLIFSVAQAKPPNLFSLIKYLELFGWSSIERDKAAYFTATLQIVIQYVMNTSLCGGKSCTADETLVVGNKENDL